MAGFRWFQVVSGWFQVILRFSKYKYKYLMMMMMVMMMMMMMMIATYAIFTYHCQMFTNHLPINLIFFITYIAHTFAIVCTIKWDKFG